MKLEGELKPFLLDNGENQLTRITLLDLIMRTGRIVPPVVSTMMNLAISDYKAFHVE